jgi:hypothetical protein
VITARCDEPPVAAAISQFEHFPILLGHPAAAPTPKAALDRAVQLTDGVNAPLSSGDSRIDKRLRHLPDRVHRSAASGSMRRMPRTQADLVRRPSPPLRRGHTIGRCARNRCFAFHSVPFRAALTDPRDLVRRLEDVDRLGERVDHEHTEPSLYIRRNSAAAPCREETVVFASQSVAGIAHKAVSLTDRP